MLAHSEEPALCSFPERLQINMLEVPHASALVRLTEDTLAALTKRLTHGVDPEATNIIQPILFGDDASLPQPILFGDDASLPQPILLGDFSCDYIRQWDVIKKLELVSIILSPGCLISLDESSRHFAGIPPNAVLFSFVYGAVRKDGSRVQESEANLHNVDKSDLFVSLLLHGGFIYLDAQGGILLITAIVEELSNLAAQTKKLFFRCPGPAAHTLEVKLTSTGRFVPTTISRIVNTGAMEYSWLYPQEHPAGAHGGFVYRMATHNGTILKFFPIAFC